MKINKPITFNRFVIVFNTIISALLFTGTFRKPNDDWDGILFYLAAPIVFLAQLIISFVLENRKGDSFNSDFYACGMIFLVFPLSIITHSIIVNN